MITVEACAPLGCWRYFILVQQWGDEKKRQPMSTFKIKKCARPAF